MSLQSAVSYVKDPDASKDYGWDWTDWLAGDTIAASTWVVPAGLVAGATGFTATGATQWLSGGADGADYVVTNRITTAAGRVDDRSFTVQVRSL